MNEGEVHICHTIVCELTLSAALSEVAAFLGASASAGEICVLYLKCDWEMRAEWQSADNWYGRDSRHIFIPGRGPQWTACGCREQVQAIVLSVLGDMACSEAEFSLPLSVLLARKKRAVVLIEAPSGVEIWTGCGVRTSADSCHLRSSWSDSITSAGDVIVAAEAWVKSGEIQPKKGCLKVLEVAVPGSPLSSAQATQAAFCRWLSALESPLRIAVQMDSPEEATTRLILQQNWQQ